MHAFLSSANCFKLTCSKLFAKNNTMQRAQRLMSFLIWNLHDIIFSCISCLALNYFTMVNDGVSCKLFENTYYMYSTTYIVWKCLFFYQCVFKCGIGSAVAQWLSAWLETEGPRVRASPASLRCGPWARHIYPSLVLVQPRKTRPA